MAGSLKAVLLSALVFPGLGHLVLKRPRRGLVLMLVVTGALAVIVTTALRQARLIVENIQSSGAVLDMAAISRAAAEASAGAGDWMTGLSTLALAACWLFGVVDAWRIGRAIDLRERRAGSGEKR